MDRTVVLASLVLSGCGGSGTRPDARPAPAFEVGETVMPATALESDAQALAEPSSDDVRPGSIAPSEPELPDAGDLEARSDAELLALFEALDRIEGREPGARARLTQIGDSHTASDTSTSSLRRELQARFGDGGRGFLHAGLPWDSYRQRHASYDMGGDWTVFNGMRRPDSGPYGFGGLRIDSGAADAWIERADDTPFDRIGVHLLVGPGRGTLEVIIDGEQRAVFDTVGEVEGFGHSSFALESEATHVRVEVADALPVSLLGTSTWRSSGGLVVDSVGINGAQASHFAAIDGDVARAELAALDPDLIIVAFGTNEAWNLRDEFTGQGSGDDGEARIARFEQRFGGLLAGYREAVPDASCLVLLPPDLFDDESACIDAGDAPAGDGNCHRLPPNSLGAIIDAERRAAGAHGCATWDQQAAMGGPGGMSRWSAMDPALGARDGVHLTSRGYDRLGTRLAQDLIGAWLDWRSGGSGQLRTSSTLDAELVSRR